MFGVYFVLGSVLFIIEILRLNIYGAYLAIISLVIGALLLNSTTKATHRGVVQCIHGANILFIVSYILLFDRYSSGFVALAIILIVGWGMLFLINPTRHLIYSGIACSIEFVCAGILYDYVDGALKVVNDIAIVISMFATLLFGIYAFLFANNRAQRYVETRLFFHVSGASFAFVAVFLLFVFDNRVLGSREIGITVLIVGWVLLMAASSGFETRDE